MSILLVPEKRHLYHGLLGGLRWTDVDLDAATITIAQQLTGMGEKPTFGPTKTGSTRTVSISAEIVALLRL
jgi:integrase